MPKMIKNKKKAFSLLEVVIALFVFSLLVATLANVYVGFLSAQQKSKESQRSLESSQTALNILAKTLRTSKIVGTPTGSLMRVFDYSRDTEKCMEFSVASENLLMASSADADTDENLCETAVMGAATSLIEGRVMGGFSILPSEEGVSVGKAVISFQLCPKGSDATACNVDAAGVITGNPINIQTSVSLRSGLAMAAAIPPAATCSDGIQNGDETGVDCGGSCGACAPVDTTPPSVPTGLAGTLVSIIKTPLGKTRIV